MSRKIWVALLWSFLILLLCWIPRDLLFAIEQKAAGGIELGRLNIDKVVHVFMFFGFGWLWARALDDWPPSACVRAVFLGGLLFAALSELGQLIPWIGRSMHLIDLLFDLGGLALGLWLQLRFRTQPAAAEAAA